jgi:hypothetical protein
MEISYCVFREEIDQKNARKLPEEFGLFSLKEET